MSPLTIGGLPVLAIIEDFHADATGNARRRTEELTRTSDRPDFEGATAGSNSITHSKAALIAGKNSVVAINATTGNTGTSL